MGFWDNITDLVEGAAPWSTTDGPASGSGSNQNDQAREVLHRQTVGKDGTRNCLRRLIMRSKKG